MKVKTVIEYLQKVNPELDVFIQDLDDDEIYDIANIRPAAIGNTIMFQFVEESLLLSEPVEPKAESNVLSEPVEPKAESNVLSEPVKLLTYADYSFDDYMEHKRLIEEDGCPRCGSKEVVWEEDDASYYCETCHTYI